MVASEWLLDMKLPTDSMIKVSLDFFFISLFYLGENRINILSILLQSTLYIHQLNEKKPFELSILELSYYLSFFKDILTKLCMHGINDINIQLLTK